ALDRGDVAPDGGGREHQACTREHPVDQHRTRAALALLARPLRTGQPEPLPQDVQEALAQPRVADFVVGAVDAQDVLLAHGKARRSRRVATTAAAWRR